MCPAKRLVTTRSDLRSCLVGQPLRSCKIGRRAASGEKTTQRRAICHDPCYRSSAVLTGANLPSQMNNKIDICG
ncbi:hypothetical protein HYC85_030491 [Camellia sinensis]|uniref:Uncharacterized protein n=1 Tax=Camellia sinensis TaxID=4442 RepID=A0A7J7G0V0_CAMSI|nr:hypothetical protein HYC85_030491 [Camellia sinensis]